MSLRARREADDLTLTARRLSHLIAPGEQIGQPGFSVWFCFFVRRTPLFPGWQIFHEGTMQSAREQGGAPRCGVFHHCRQDRACSLAFASAAPASRSAGEAGCAVLGSSSFKYFPSLPPPPVS
jgi:hypothetical protein